MYASASVSHFCHRTSAHDRCLYRHPRRLRQKNITSQYVPQASAPSYCTVHLNVVALCNKWMTLIRQRGKQLKRQRQESTLPFVNGSCQRLANNCCQRQESPTAARPIRCGRRQDHRISETLHARRGERGTMRNIHMPKDRTLNHIGTCTGRKVPRICKGFEEEPLTSLLSDVRGGHTYRFQTSGRDCVDESRIVCASLPCGPVKLAPPFQGSSRVQRQRFSATAVTTRHGMNARLDTMRKNIHTHLRALRFHPRPRKQQINHGRASYILHADGLVKWVFCYSRCADVPPTKVQPHGWRDASVRTLVSKLEMPRVSLLL